MVSHPETGSDPPIGSDRESGCDTAHSIWMSHMLNVLLTSSNNY